MLRADVVKLFDHELRRQAGERAPDPVVAALLGAADGAPPSSSGLLRLDFALLPAAAGAVAVWAGLQLAQWHNFVIMTGGEAGGATRRAVLCSCCHAVGVRNREAPAS